MLVSIYKTHICQNNLSQSISTTYIYNINYKTYIEEAYICRSYVHILKIYNFNILYKKNI